MRWIKCIIIIAFAFGFLSACSEKKQQTEKPANEQTYTCSMHPQIVQSKPGTCPICSMDLVAYDKNNTGETLMLSDNQRLLANIQTDTLRTGKFSTTKQLNGRIAVDPDQTAVIASRIGGRLEQLYVKQVGEVVRKGAPLYAIYSEQLAVLQQEFIVAAEQAAAFPGDVKFQQIAAAAKQRLLLLGQSNTQVLALQQSKKTNPAVTYYAPAGGTVSEVYATQGQYVAEGGPILRIEGYGSVWVEADVYPAEASNARVGQQVSITVVGYENKIQKMRVDFLAPSLQTGSQLLTLRGKIDNPNGTYRPGMQVFVQLPVVATSSAFTLPADAVIRRQAGAHVWVETEPGIFEARSVTTGAEGFERVEIVTGLQAGEQVVTSGAYLLYSEFVLKKGADPVKVHQH